MKNFISVKDADNIYSLVDQSLKLKKDPFSFAEKGKNICLGLIFLNPSLRTRMSTQKAAMNLGMQVIVMNLDKEGWAIETEDGVVMEGTKSEHIAEAAGVVGQYCDIIGLRSFPGLADMEADYKEDIINKFKKYSGRPVLNLESSTLHPLQSLADLITIEEFKPKPKPKVVLTWAPHVKALPQAVPNSFAQWMLAANMDFVITHPEGYELHEEFTSGARIEYDQRKAFDAADFIYAKNWSSFKSYGQILRTDREWTIDNKKMVLTNNAKFMHCLPVRRNVVVADEVLDGEASIVLKQAENRIYAAQAVLFNLIDNITGGRA